MAMIHFTGTAYNGMDSSTNVIFSAPGHYPVSDEKAAQLAADFPQQFTQVLEGQETTAEKAPSGDEVSQEVAEPTHETKARAKPTKKGK